MRASASILLHRILPVNLLRAVRAEHQTRPPHSERCSGAWRMGRRLRLERRLRHFGQGRLQRQYRPGAGDVFPGRCHGYEARPRLQEGPCILVGHSYGGAVITEAGTDPSVVGLVYIAAHMPDAGENESDDGKRFPSDLNKSNAIKKTADGFTYLDPAQFHEYFAADVPAEQAAFMAQSQVLNKADNFRAVITTPAWRSKPSWMLVAGSDRAINPDLERWYATRANSHKVEVPGASHAVYVSHPERSCSSDRGSCVARTLEEPVLSGKPTVPHCLDLHISTT